MTDFIGQALDSFDRCSGSLGSLARSAIIHPTILLSGKTLVSLGGHRSGAQREASASPCGCMYHWVDLRAEPFRNDDGDIVQWYAVCVDIEVQTRMQNELRVAQDKLSRATQAARPGRTIRLDCT